MKKNVHILFLLSFVFSALAALSQGSLKHEWSKNLSNTAIAGGQVEGRAITTDAAGNIYTGGKSRRNNRLPSGTASRDS